MGKKSKFHHKGSKRKKDDMSDDDEIELASVPMASKQNCEVKTFIRHFYFKLQYFS